MITDYKIPPGGGSNFRLISQFFSNLDLKIKHDYRLQDCAGWGGGVDSFMINVTMLFKSWSTTKLRTRDRSHASDKIWFHTPLPIQHQARLQITRLRAGGGGGSNFGLMTHLFKAGSPDLRRLQITTLHAGGSHFWLNSPFSSIWQWISRSNEITDYRGHPMHT